MIEGSGVEGPRALFRSFVYITPAVLQSLILNGKLSLGARLGDRRTYYCGDHFMKKEIYALLYVRWMFGTNNTGRVAVGDRLNEVTVD